MKGLRVLVGALPVAIIALVGATSAAAGGPQAVTIKSNSDFLTCGCVTAGSGTAASPYVIGPFAVPAPSNGTSGWAVKVDNSLGKITDYFNITGVSAGYNDTNTSDPVIWLVNVHTATSISAISANNDGIGVELDSSSNITLDNVSVNKMNSTGLYIDGSSNISVSNSKFKATQDGQQPPTLDGLYAVNSTNLNVGGVAACPKSQACNSFDYDSGFGIHLVNSNYVVIDHASANADDTGGFILDKSSYVTLSNSVSEGDGPICLTVNGVKTHTGYFSDLQGGLMLVNGASNNTIQGDAFAADTPISLGSGGNGYFADPCSKANVPVSNPEGPMGTGNQFSSTCYTSNTAGLPPNPCR